MTSGHDPTRSAGSAGTSTTPVLGGGARSVGSWPTPADVRAELRIPADAPVSDDSIQRVIDASRSYTARRCGFDDPDDPGFVPTAQLVEAVLLRTLRAHRRHDSPLGVVDVFDLGAVYPTKIDPDFEALLVGERSGWGIG